MEYDIELTIKITSFDKRIWTWGEIELKLPFTPTIGLNLIVKDTVSMPLESLSYDIEENVFYCHTSHEIQYHDEDLEFWVEYFRERGWKGFADLHKDMGENQIEIEEGFFLQ